MTRMRSVFLAHRRKTARWNNVGCVTPVGLSFINALLYKYTALGVLAVDEERIRLRNVPNADLSYMVLQVFSGNSRSAKD